MGLRHRTLYRRPRASLQTAAFSLTPLPSPLGRDFPWDAMVQAVAQSLLSVLKSGPQGASPVSPGCYGLELLKTSWLLR